MFNEKVKEIWQERQAMCASLGERLEKLKQHKAYKWVKEKLEQVWERLMNIDVLKSTVDRCRELILSIFVLRDVQDEIEGMEKEAM